MSDLTSISFHPSLRLPVMGGLREHLLGWAGRSWLRGEKRHREGGVEQIVGHRNCLT